MLIKRQKEERESKGEDYKLDVDKETERREKEKEMEREMAPGFEDFFFNCIAACIAWDFETVRKLKMWFIYYYLYWYKGKHSKYILLGLY